MWNDAWVGRSDKACFWLCEPKVKLSSHCYAKLLERQLEPEAAFLRSCALATILGKALFEH